MIIYAYGNKWHLYPNCRGTQGEAQEVCVTLMFTDKGYPYFVNHPTLCSDEQNEQFMQYVCGTCLRSKARIFKIAAMRKMREEGAKMREIGEAFGISRQRVYQYLEE